MQVSYRTMIYCSMQYYMKTLRMSLKLQLQKYSDPDNVYCTKINHDRSNNQILTFTCVHTTYSMASAIEELKSFNLKFVTLTVAHVLSPRAICGRDVPVIHPEPGKCRISHYSVLPGHGKIMGLSNKKRYFLLFTLFYPRY